MKRRKLAVLGGFGVIAIVIALAAGRYAHLRCTTVQGKDAIEISIARLMRGTVNFFCYRDSAGQKLRFLLTRGEDGTIRSVMDACRQCYAFHKGYRISGDYLICGLCGTRYRLKEIQSGKASCVPVSLPFRQNGENVQVKVADLEKWRSLF